MMLFSCDSKYNPNLILQHGSTTYDYDFLGQLISADYANATISDESYTYDSNGNRLTANGSTYTTSTNNELTSDGAYTYTYDDEGNRISKQNSTNRELYTWDYRNRLTSVTQQEFNTETQEWTTVQIVEYTYDYNNVWIRKIIGNEKTIFIPENYQTTVQIDNNTITHHYLWTPNTQDKLLADVTNTEILWSLTDHLGTVRDIIQSTTTGIVTQAHVIYDAYGNIISCKNSEGQTVDNPLLFAYTGKAFDTSTSLQNNINRWYDATVGRWLSIDPIGFYGGDTNLYRYVSNSILTQRDMWGLYDIEKLLCTIKKERKDLYAQMKREKIKIYETNGFRRKYLIHNIKTGEKSYVYEKSNTIGLHSSGTIILKKVINGKERSNCSAIAILLHEMNHASDYYAGTLKADRNASEMKAYLDSYVLSYYLEKGILLTEDNPIYQEQKEKIEAHLSNSVAYTPQEKNGIIKKRITTEPFPNKVLIWDWSKEPDCEANPPLCPGDCK